MAVEFVCSEDSTGGYVNGLWVHMPAFVLKSSGGPLCTLPLLVTAHAGVRSVTPTTANWYGS
jgi:hypothetical protein